MKIIRSSIVPKRKNATEVDIEIVIDEETSEIKIGNQYWILDTSNLKEVCEDALDILDAFFGNEKVVLK